MNAEWKPGDVAMVTVAINEEPRVMLRMDGSHWLDVEQEYWDKACGDWKITDARPLVVIDPEDSEQVERFVKACPDDWAFRQDEETVREVVVLMQAALREFANPTPTKPDEPTGRYAVVEDDQAVEWVRAELVGIAQWQSIKGSASRWAKWDNIAAVRVLSDGVTS